MASGEARSLSFHWDVRHELDCNKKLIITINGKTLGPTIRAQQGDTVVVKVSNSLIGTPWCDGTNGPILAVETCTYRFVADRSGDYSYQSEYWMRKRLDCTGQFGFRRRAAYIDRTVQQRLRQW